jgi:hypothetical protein
VLTNGGFGGLVQFLGHHCFTKFTRPIDFLSRNGGLQTFWMVKDFYFEKTLQLLKGGPIKKHGNLKLYLTPTIVNKANVGKQ